VVRATFQARLQPPTARPYRHFQEIPVKGPLIVSRLTQPLLYACRALAGEGVDPSTCAVIRYEGQNHDALQSIVGAAAKLTVYDHRPSLNGDRALFATRRNMRLIVSRLGQRPAKRVFAGLARETAETLALARGEFGVAFAHDLAETLALDRGEFGVAFVHEPVETPALRRSEFGQAFAHETAETLALRRSEFG
jgi:hypothetical protein